MSFFEQLMIASAESVEPVVVTTETVDEPEKPFAVILDDEPIAWFDNAGDALIDASEVGGAVFNEWTRVWIH